MDIPKVCSYTACPNKVSTLVNGEKLMACSLCRTQWFCGKECQKNAWTKEGHKYCCAKPDVPRHTVEGNTIESIQSTIDLANVGDIVILKEGVYSSSKKKQLEISKPIRLIGPPNGMESVQLNCSLSIDDKKSCRGSVTIVNLTIKGNIKVKTNYYDSITFCLVKTQQDNPKEDGVMVHIMKGEGKCLFFQCEIIGGDEALYIDGIDDLSHSREKNTDKVHIKRCTIRNGTKRGICADDKFILESSTIRDNGWYGIRSNLGWTDKGKNDWQRNPAKPNAGPNGGGGMFDGPAIPIGGAGGLFSAGDTMFPGFGQNAERRY